MIKRKLGIYRSARIGAAFVAAYKEFRHGKSESEIFDEMEDSTLEENVRVANTLEKEKSSDDAHGVEAGAKAIYVEKEKEKSGGISAGLIAFKKWAIRAIIVKGLSLLITSVAIVIALAIGVAVLGFALRTSAPETYCSVNDWFSDGDTYDRCIDTVFDWETLDRKREISPNGENPPPKDNLVD